MVKVNIYTYSTAKSPKAAQSQCEAVGFVIEYQDSPNKAYARMKRIQGMSWNQSELYVLERALSRINAMYEVHIYTECPYIAAGFEQGWLEKWIANDWKTSANEEVKNKVEWQALIALVKEKIFVPVFHVKEDHPYRKWLKANIEKEKERCKKVKEK